MTGAADPAYILARRVLLDALDALHDHADAIILVGAQAVYLHTGEGSLAVAPYTTDADLVIDPTQLKPDPRLADALARAGFVTSSTALGIWTSGTSGVTTDLLVPEAIATGGRRSVDLGAHGNRIARKARGLEATLVDNELMILSALDPADTRRREVHVAGLAALLVAKLHKVADRKSSPSRLDDKDALDILRILQARETADLARTMASLEADERSGQVTREARGYLKTLFGSVSAPGTRMVARAVGGLADQVTIAQSVSILARDLLDAFR